MSTRAPSPYRLPAFAIILGAFLTLTIDYLILQIHGPYEEALDRIV